MQTPASITGQSSIMLAKLHKTLRLCVLPITAVLLSACDGGQLLSAQAPVQLKLDALPTVAAAHADQGESLLVNGSFERGLTGWDACNRASNLRIVKKSSAGKHSVRVKQYECIQQALRVSPGTELSLSCDIGTTNRKHRWAGLGISYYDVNGIFISEPPATVIPRHRAFRNYTVSGDAPGQAYYAMAWFYTDRRGWIDNCSLTAEQPPVLDSNLLVNGSFDSLEDSDDPAATGVSFLFNTSFDVEQSNIRPVHSPLSQFALAIDFEASGASAKQSLTGEALQALSGTDFLLSCDARNNHPVQAGFLQISFLDNNADPIPANVGFSASIPPQTTEFQPVTLTGTVPASNDLSGTVTIIAGNRLPQNSTVEVDNCVLTVVN